MGLKKNIVDIFKKNMLVAVFSYNRGEYLENCIKSLESNFPCENIKIYDDDSSCSYTQAYLSKIKKKYPVYINKKKVKNNLKGLYLNMNKALEDAITGDFQYVFFIQDDIQIVRSCDSNFFDECIKIFNGDKKIVQISPIFFKENCNCCINKDLGYYENKGRKYVGISDVGIIKTDELKRVRWNWEPDKNEEENMKRALMNYSWKFVFYKNPIMMYLPWPRTFRSVNFFQRKYNFILEFFFNAGFYPYKNLGKEKLKKMLSRDISVLPLAEKYLETEARNVKTPWVYTTPKLNFFKRCSKILNSKDR